MSLRFDFGRNWQDFSAAKLNTQRISDAERSLETLLGDKIRGQTFLDVGCGSGLFSIAAAKAGATRIAAFDFNATAIKVAEGNWARFATGSDESAVPYFRVGDVLDQDFLASLGQFDIVYAWGVLHHTGAMWKAIQNAASLVRPDGGTLVVAIYNRHWTSPVWKQVKRLYNLSPAILRQLLNYVFGAAIYAGVWTTTGQNPLLKERGMDFWYDVIDWLGGYPYEYARIAEMVSYVEPLGFRVENITRPRTATGCNEFVFRGRTPT